MQKSALSMTNKHNLEISNSGYLLLVLDLELVHTLQTTFWISEPISQFSKFKSLLMSKFDYLFNVVSHSIYVADAKIPPTHHKLVDKFLAQEMS